MAKYNENQEAMDALDEEEKAYLYGAHTKKKNPLEQTNIDEVSSEVELDLPGTEASGEILEGIVIPVLADEFTCTRCFLVVHRTRRSRPDVDICTDCA